jgi:hypothetical protein
LNFLSGYKTYIAGAGLMLVGLGECIGGIAAGLGEGGQFDAILIASGLTKISAGLGFIGARAAYAKGTTPPAI